MENKTETKSKNVWVRCFIEVFLVLGFLSMILVNSLYTDGYLCSKNSQKYNNLIIESKGYEAKKNAFTYTGDEKSYVQISASGYTEQMLLVFAKKSKTDTEVTVSCVDAYGNVSGRISKGIWKRGEYTAKIDVAKGEYSSYLLNIPANFKLSEVYYARDNDYSGPSKTMLMFIAIAAVLLLTVIIMCIRMTAEAVAKIDRAVILFLKNIYDCRKKIGEKALSHVIILLLFLALSYLGSYSGYYRFSGKTAVLSLFAGAIVSLFIVHYRSMAKRIECIGFFTVLLTGSMIAVLSPANVGVSWDDQIHYYRAVKLSHVFDKQISAADTAIIDECVEVGNEKKYFDKTGQRRSNMVMEDLERAGYYENAGEREGIVSSAAYLPQAAGLVVARGLGLPFAARVMLGRWMNTLLLAVLSFFAMKKLQNGKLVVLLIVLIPTNIFIAGNYAYDTWLTAWSILGLSAFFGEWQRPEKKMKKRTMCLIAGSMFLAVLPKLVYFPIILITLFMPLSKFETKRQCYFYRMIIMASAMLPLCTAYLQNIAHGMGAGEELGDIRGGAEVNAAAQLDFIRNNPAHWAKIMFRFLSVYLNPVAEGREYITNMTYYCYSPMNEKLLLGAIVAGAFVSRDENETGFPWWTKAGVLLVYAGIGFVAAFSMYVAFTAVASETVLGCQGRYLMPALFPALYVCSRFSLKPWLKNIIKEENINIILLTLLTAGTVWGVWTGCVSLY